MALEDILSSPGDSMNTSACSRGNVGNLVDINVTGQDCSRLFLIMPPANKIIRGTAYGGQGETTSTARRPSRTIGM